MKKLLFVPFFLTFSCSGELEKSSAPANLIASEKMIPLIVDLQILESHFQRTYNRPDLYKASLDSSSQLIFDKHQVTKSQYDSSYMYYAKDLDAIYQMYEAALDSLNFAVIENQ
jgi:hypothetical protein